MADDFKDLGFVPDQEFEALGFQPETEKKEEIPKSSTLKDAALGFQQGAQLGFSDELAAIGSTLGSVAGDVLFGLPKKDLEGYLKEYREAQQAEQKRFQEAKESSPWAYGAGQFGGALVPGIIAGPAAVAAPVKVAALGGGVAAAGESTAPIEQEPGRLALETLIGTGTGAAFGKLLPGGKKAGAAKDITKRGEFLPQMEAAKQLGEEGVSLSSKPAARRALTERLQASERELAKPFTEPRELLGKRLENLVSKASNEGVVLTQSMDDIRNISNIGDLINKNASAIGSAEAKKLLKQIDDLGKGILDPSEAYQLRKSLSNISSKIADPGDQQILKTGMGTITDVIDNSVPGFRKQLDEFRRFAEAGPESLLAKGHDPEVADVFFGDLKKGELKIAEKVRSLLENMRVGGKEGLKKQGEFYNTIRQLEKLGKENPELLKRLKIDPKALERAFLEKSDEAAVALKTAGKSLPEAGAERGVRGIRAISEEALLKSANVYGQAKRKVKDVFGLPQAELLKDSATLKQSGNSQLASLGESLEKALTENDINKRNALLFAILQQPKARDILGVSPDEE